MSSPDLTFRRLLACLIVVAVVLLGVVALALRNEGRAVAAADWVNHTHALRAEAAGILSSLREAEGALRTYLLTGDPRDQADYRAAFSDLAEHVDVAKALARPAPADASQIARLEERLVKRADLARELIRVRQGGAPEELRALLAADAGGEAVREIGRRVDRFREEQAQLLTERDRAAYLQAQTTRWTVLCALVLDLLLLAGAAWLIRDDLQARRRAAAALRLANEQLESRVRERTAELSAANTALKAQSLEDRWARLALEHQLHYNHLIIDAVSELAIVVTKNLNISRINPAVGHLSGLAAAALVDRPLAALVKLAGAAASDDLLARALKEGRDLREQSAVLTDSAGRHHSLVLNFFPLRDSDKVVGGVVTLRLPPAPAA
ncbi:MAG: CHASE3 domain-containing protein [Opitutae bacterium]|nr:CHASE3 domain-containing protein [Opitutae bacterium]